ncbi:MAG: transcriptional regulator [Ignavibacteriae bacterium HGW-Ignavibacteriae-2]|jgi:Rrf2 family protein|nr:Rrf2 family transcriptional regulator [Bacteroidota bacterium]PKL90370.1 MAG: transcriptional regulator [Ignavibacteriae bacterium HGW-Ignavibacteriae-2]
MKFSAQEEYGIRCLIRIGKYYDSGEVPTILQISKEEKISQHNVAKLLRVLRLGGILDSERGFAGGYTLSKSPEEIKIVEVLDVLGGRLFDDEFCMNHSGSAQICTHTVDCSVRSLWKVIQQAVDGVIGKLTLRDLLGQEDYLFSKLNLILSDINNIQK